jgi:hypothetical protein
MDPHRIVAHGHQTLLNHPEIKTRLRALHDSIMTRHATELATAGFFKRLGIRWQMMREYERERLKIVPSRYVLWLAMDSQSAS